MFNRRLSHKGAEACCVCKELKEDQDLIARKEGWTCKDCLKGKKVNKMDLKVLTRIHWKKIEESTIIRYPEVQELCHYPYPNHKKGCPNIGNCLEAPYFNFLVKNGCYQHYYLFYAKFDFKSYLEQRKKEHPTWSSRQLRSVLYWQGSIKKLLKIEIEKLSKNGNRFFVLGCGSKMKFSFQKIVYSMESTCINVFSTLKLNKIKFELKPENSIILCCLLCSWKELIFRKQQALGEK